MKVVKVIGYDTYMMERKEEFWRVLDLASEKVANLSFPFEATLTKNSEGRSILNLPNGKRLAACFMNF